MPHDIDANVLARLLPGTWRVGATNFPMWLAGDRLDPLFRYELRSTEPLEFDEVTSWTTVTGEEKIIVGIDRWNTDGFIWKGKGLLSIFTTRWSVIGVTEDLSVAVIRFTKTLATPAGVNVIIRNGLDPAEIRTLVARSTEELGLTHGEFAGLSWLEIRPL